MSFSKYIIEKKQVSLDMGVTWQDATPSETRNGRLLGTYKTLIECENADCEIEPYIYRDSSHEGQIDDLGVTLKDNTKIEIKLRPTHYCGPNIGMIIGEVNPPSDNDDYRFFWDFPEPFNNKYLYYDYGNDRLTSPLPIDTDYVFEVGNYYIKDLTTGSYILQGDAKSGVATAHTRTLGLFVGHWLTYNYAFVYYIKIYEGDTLVKDFIPAKLEDGSGTLYDKVSKTYCSVSNGTLGIYTE